MIWNEASLDFSFAKIREKHFAWTLQNKMLSFLFRETREYFPKFRKNERCGKLKSYCSCEVCIYCNSTEMESLGRQTLPFMQRHSGPAMAVLAKQ